MDFDLLRSLNLNLGSLQIGFLVSCFLFGSLSVQALIYNRKFAPKDARWLKFLVLAIWLLELGELGCIAHGLYYITITKSGQFLALLHPPRTIGASFLIGSLTGPLIEAFYVSRLLRFSGRLPVALVGWALALARCAGWVFLGTRVLLSTSLSAFVNEFGWLLAMLLGVSAVIDLTISVWIAYFLAQQRSRAQSSTNESARQLLDRVILWTLQTGVITSLSFLVTLVCYLVLGDYLIWLAVLAMLTKGAFAIAISLELYLSPSVSSNCFLASLNARSSTKFQRRGDGPRPAHARGGSRATRTGGASASLHNTAHSLVNGIIDLYQLSSHAEQEQQRQDSEHPTLLVGDRPYGHALADTADRSTSRASFTGAGGDIYDRSAFSPDGTVVSVATAQSRRSGYWAL
ncbi:hypothetical protein MKEN_01040600 [Mycena kentingensis (nom. inval.)]|nr:hypothetical protein MKEN_01040600 [Mycena kentingensis (nom. inval.)]